MGKKSSGPVSYTHTKVYKPTPSIEYEATLMAIVPSEVKLPPRATKDCDAGCEMVILRGVTVMSIVKREYGPKGWTILPNWKMADWPKPNFGPCANPAWRPDIIWVRGRGSRTSMMYYNSKWWSLYGIKEVGPRKKGGTLTSAAILDESDPRERYYILHNIKLPAPNPACPGVTSFDPTMLNKGKDKILEDLPDILMEA